ncbi:uncharacterized protein LOC121736726 [Aricia agestis]|uniref:uncharacterized protein LOC121736726 n=1 Tax=Aricia agestis TaxID=91739 RepID=UPI001C20A162|nr:uncharacterized protein LOC121736726 [Aricia agestis]
MVGVKAANGDQHHLRALIDSGSQISVITERAAQILGLKRRRCKGTIFGVGPTSEEPIAQQTYLGWILCGSVKSYQCNVMVHNNYDDLQRFWECEDISLEKEMTSEDEFCLQYFSKTTKRLEDGRFEVRLPIIEELKHKLGSSKTTALAQYQSLERRLDQNIALANDYKRFMQEYMDLSHMERSASERKMEFYLPHHGVIRDSSTTTKLRVVFNASAKSSSGYSLNDIMYKGPNLQQDLQQIILKWRQFKFAYTADIEKMYRQIWVFPEDQAYQRIFWRESKDQPVQVYQLKTVTYGEKAASFLAINCLKQLAAEEKKKYPEAAKEVEESFFVDDFCGGHHTLQQSKQLQADLIELLKSGGFNLRKWRSNEKQLLADLDTEQCDKQTYEFKHMESTKTLGLSWDPQAFSLSWS